MRVTNAHDYHEPRDSISHDWITHLVSWGMRPMPVPNIGCGAVDYVSALAPALLILSGGEDLGVSPLRDETEMSLLSRALDTGLPVLGVCRGLQLMNTHFGGRLGKIDGHVAQPHDVSFDGAWTELYGNKAQVNSYHNCRIAPNELAPTLHATGLDDDGNVEAAIYPGLPLAGVMWHPERDGAPIGDRRLIDALIAEGKQ